MWAYNPTDIIHIDKQIKQVISVGEKWYEIKRSKSKDQYFIGPKIPEIADYNLQGYVSSTDEDVREYRANQQHIYPAAIHQCTPSVHDQSDFKEVLDHSQDEAICYHYQPTTISTNQRIVCGSHDRSVVNFVRIDCFIFIVALVYF